MAANPQCIGNCRICTVLGACPTDTLVCEDCGEEIEPGVPAMTGTTNLGELQLVLKSGSFGSEFFLEKAARYLQGERAYDCKQED